MWSLQLLHLLLRLFSLDVTLYLKDIILKNKDFPSYSLSEARIACNHLRTLKDVQGVYLKEDFWTFHSCIYTIFQEILWVLFNLNSII